MVVCKNRTKLKTKKKEPWVEFKLSKIMWNRRKANIRHCHTTSDRKIRKMIRHHHTNRLKKKVQKSSTHTEEFVLKFNI